MGLEGHPTGISPIGVRHRMPIHACPAAGIPSSGYALNSMHNVGEGGPTGPASPAVHFGNKTLVKEFRIDVKERPFVDRGEISEDISKKIEEDESVKYRDPSRNQTSGNVRDSDRAAELLQWTVSPKQLKRRLKESPPATEMARDRARLWEAWTRDEPYMSA